MDEVHERDLDTDLLCLLIRILFKRWGSGEGGFKGFKLVCMSATFDANEFVRYYRPVARSVGPPLHVGGLRFPITTFYLDHVIRSTAALTAQEIDHANRYLLNHHE